MKSATLKDIANTLGLSVPTVSKALKDYPDVSQKTKTLVKDLAKTLNYQPNAFAVSLRKSESKTIGVIIPETVHHFFSSVLKGIIHKAEEKGYLVIILQSNESYTLEKKQIDLLLRSKVDGILISIANSTSEFKHLTSVISKDIPLVMFDKIAKVVSCSKVIINDREAAYRATTHLIKTGCRKIAHFRGPLMPQNSIDRFLGYKKALEDHELIYDPKLVYICEDMSFDEGKKYAKQLLNDHKDVDGIFVNTDLVAIGAINELNEQNIKIPEDISIIGFSNWFMSSVITPTLSSVEQNAGKLGEESIRILFDEMDAKQKGISIEHQKIVIETELILRNSC